MPPEEPRPHLVVDAVYGPGDVAEPRRMVLGHAVYDIVEIVDRWYEGPRRAGGPVRHTFKVRSRGGACFLLSHEVTQDVWQLVRAFGPEQPPGTSPRRT